MKKIKYLIQAVVVIAIALAFVLPGAASSHNKIVGINENSLVDASINRYNPQSSSRDVLFEDDFESYDDFVLDFPPWTQYDGDGLPTWGIDGVDFPNAGYVGSFIIFVPSQTTPPLDDTPHSGEKYAACFDGAEDPPINPNDDWLITPQLTSSLGTDFYVAIHCVDWDGFWLGIDDFSVSEVDDTATITFWAKTYSGQYEPDRFQVGVSLTDNDPESFFFVTPDPYVEPPTTWTEYTYEVDLIPPEEPELEIEVSGGFGVSATVNNVGNADATNCTVTFTIEGGFFLLPSGGTATVSLETIAQGDSASGKMTVLGIGKPTITVDVTCDEGASASATYEPTFVFLFFVIG